MPYIGNNHIAGDHTNNFKVLDDISSFTATFDGSASSVVDTTNNTIRVVEHRFIQGQRVTYTNGSGGNIGGLTTGTAYFVIFDSASTIKLATSASNAASSTAINLSAVGTGSSHTLNVAFDGVNTKFKLTHGSGTGARLNNATQINVAINNVVQRPNLDPNNFTDGFALEDNHKIVFQTAPTSEDIFWGSIIANTLTTFDISDHKIDTFTGDGSTTEFTLSHTPANNESLMVTINGVLQHPSNASTSRAYTLIASIIQFTAAPANGDEIQVRHLGFAGATTADVSGFYGRTGNVVLTANDHITTGDITARNINASGILTASSASFGGNVSIGGTLTYEDVTNIDSVGIITARDGIDCNGDIDVDGHTNLDNVSVAGVTTFSSDTHVGTGITFHTNGQGEFAGVVTFTANDQTRAAHFPNNKRAVFGSTSLYGSIYNTGSNLNFEALNRYTFKCWDGNTQEPWLRVSGVSGTVRIGGEYMGNNGNRQPELNVAGHIYKTITMSSSDGSNLTERFKLSQGGFNFTGLSTHTGNFDLDGDLDVDGHTNLDNVSVAGVSTFSGNIFGTGDLTLTSTDAGSSASPIINLFRNSASPADADYLGQIKFQGESDTGVQRNYAKITGKILDASNGTEDGILEFAHIKAGSQTITGRWRSDSLQLLNGTALTVAGNADFSAGIDVTGVVNSTVAGGENRLKIETTSSGNPVLNLAAAGSGGHDIFYNRSTNELTFKSQGGSDRLKIAANGDLLPGTDSQYNIGSNAVRFANIYADTLYGDGSNLTGITGTTINNNADNRIITGSGTANTLNGEANLRFNGSALVLDNPNGANYFEIGSDSSNQYSIIDLKGDTTYTDYAFRIMRVNSGANAESQLAHRGTGQFSIKTVEASDIKIYTTNNERLRITSGGEVKIMNPGGTVGLYFQSSSGAVSNFRAIGTNNQSLGYFFGNDERVRFASNGYVGINTTAPSALLNVNTQSSGVTDAIVISRDVYGMVGKLTNSTGSLVVTSNKGLILQSDPSSQFTAAGSFIGFEVDGTEKARVHANGYFGINQTSPQTGLHINQDWVNSYGSISVEGSANALVGLGLRSNGNYRGSLIWRDGSSGNYLDISTYGGSYPILFRPGGSEKLRIESGGGLKFTGQGTSIPVGGILHHTNNNLYVRGGTSGLILGNQDNTNTIQISESNYIKFETNDGSEKVRITSGGQVNIGQFNNSTHMLYLASTGDAGIHIRADSNNTSGAGENYNPYLSMAQDSGNTQQFKIGMIGSAGNEFAQSIANASFIHANNTNNQPLQLAHMDNMAVTISNTEQTHFHQTSGTAIGGMKIANRGNDTGAALILQGHNNTGTPGNPTNTQLTHDGARFEFEIKHGSSRAIHVGNTRRIRMPGIVGVAGSGLVNVSVESDGNLCTTTSLREYKTNITSISDTSWLYNLNPVTFNWKKKTEVNGENVWEDTPDDNGTQYGLIAEEVEEVKKEFCYYDNDNKLSGVHYERLIAPLIKALQEQKAEIDALKTRVATLEGS